MPLLVNGKTRPFDPGLTLRQALAGWGYEPQSVAVALDGAFVPRHQYDRLTLEEGQALEIVAPMQGG
jgi:sulfur carrier protein